MTNTTGLYPQLKVDTTTSGAVGQAGGVLLTETIAASGLGRELSPPQRSWPRSFRSETSVAYISSSIRYFAR